MTEGASLDVETRSAAGFVWNAATNKWDAPKGAKKKGLGVVGTAVYAEHPTTDLLTLTYRLPGADKKRWRPGMPPPEDLFAYARAGGPFKFHNAMFEWLIWQEVLTPRYGFPPLGPYQVRCTMATARVNSLPGSLADLSDVLQLPTPKDKEGKRLLDKFSVPRNPTKGDPRAWIRPEDDPEDFEKLCAYCDTDVEAEGQADDRMPPMTQDEFTFWCVDQEINRRGIAVDTQGINDCIAVMEQVFAKYTAECANITGGLSPTQGEAIRGWLSARGVRLPNLRAATVKDALGPDFIYDLDAGQDDEEDPEMTPGDNYVAMQGMPPEARRVLEIRALTASASVKKLYAMANRVNRAGRLLNLIIHHGARTGRPTGDSVQPLNLPKPGPDLKWCAAPNCAKPFKPSHAHCPWCYAPAPPDDKKKKWSWKAVDDVLSIMRLRDLEAIEYFFGDALLTISGCIRSLFVAAPGYELIASDYSAIEAVVLAVLAGEQWRIDAFRAKEDIYLRSISKITGVSYESYIEYERVNGQHHADRQKGKINELALGFSGWVNSSKAFGDIDPDDVIKKRILAWRAASPAIVEFWGGQFRGSPWDQNARQEYFGVEGAAIQAALYPGHVFEFKGLQFFMRDLHTGPALIIRLLSGRELTYHNFTLFPATRAYSRPGEYSCAYRTWNSNPRYGPRGWVPMNTYGGRMTENVIQATAHDILRHAILTLRAAGYPTVLHVYDEIVAEVPNGLGSLEEVERLMGEMPPWAQGWPVRAAGGWRGKRYRKG